MIVDTHVHVWEIDPPKYPVGPTAPTWNTYPDEPGTADELLAEMNAHGVDWAVLVQTSWSTWDNGYIADSAARFPHRFIGHGLIDPQDPNNAEHVRYWLHERGLAGFRFHPMYYPDEKILLTAQNGPMWEEIAAAGAVIQFHLRAQEADQIEAIARRFPHLTLILDHLAYPQVESAESAYQPVVDLARYDNVHVKLSDVNGHSRSGLPLHRRASLHHPHLLSLRRRAHDLGHRLPRPPSRQTQLALSGPGTAPDPGRPAVSS